MVAAYQQTHSHQLAWSKGNWLPGVESNEPGGLSQWLRHDQNITNTGTDIIIIVALCNRADHYIFAL